MKKYLVVACIIAAICSFTKLSEKPAPAAVNDAINKSLPLLQHGSHTFLKNVVEMVNCHSCHNQGLGLVTFALAKEKGFFVSDTILREAIDSTYQQWKIDDKVLPLLENDDPLATLITGNYDLWGLHANNIQPDKLLYLISQNIMHKQQENGSWFSPGQRPPMEYYSMSLTAMAVKNMQAYMPEGLRAEATQKIDKARTWMMNTVPVANEEKAYQLLGLTWCNADKAFIKQQGKKLLAAQQDDGGWSQLTTLPTDAYATGQSLYALFASGIITTNDPSFNKGISFLLRNQQPDGSWHVKTRSYPFVPFVDSGFPHQADQFISAAGSNWATIALLLSVDK